MVLSLTLSATGTVWAAGNFAKAWFTDALREAQSGPEVPHRDALRREIVFAVCFVESYLLEWARDEALGRRFEDLPRYFPPNDRRGIRERWKGVLRDLHTDGLLVHTPDFVTTEWTDICALIDYRDGLVHASVSKPQSSSQPPGQGPSPGPKELDRESRGFAVRRVVALTRQLHRWAGTSPPSWLEEPYAPRRRGRVQPAPGPRNRAGPGGSSGPARLVVPTPKRRYQ